MALISFGRMIDGVFLEKIICSVAQEEGLVVSCAGIPQSSCYDTRVSLTRTDNPYLHPTILADIMLLKYGQHSDMFIIPFVGEENSITKYLAKVLAKIR